MTFYSIYFISECYFWKNWKRLKYFWKIQNWIHNTFDFIIFNNAYASYFLSLLFRKDTSHSKQNPSCIKFGFTYFILRIQSNIESFIISYFYWRNGLSKTSAVYFSKICVRKTSDKFVKSCWICLIIV